MKKKMILYIVGALALLSFLMAGCQKATDTPPDTFVATYNLAEAGRSISISGNSDGMPGGRSEYMLKINNGTERWQDEYYVLLLDSGSVIREISRERFDIPGGGGFQKPIVVEFPEGFEGALGLCVLIPQRGSFIAALSVGVKDAIITGWPDISTYPVSTSEGG